ncbi:MAG: Dynamin protein [Pseudomonadota bacterium]|nr:Dynamin protein [Pseudomonadota bacterium]
MNSLRHDLLETAQQFNIDLPPMQGELACAFVGEWNSGKSSLQNSLLGLPLLPEQPIPTTKTVVSLGQGQVAEPVAIIQTETGAYQEYRGPAAITALQNSTQNLPRIDYRAPQLDLPPHTLFIDTPGFNDTDQIASAKAETVQADLVVFVMNADVSALNQTQINFIQQVALSKANLQDLFFVITHSDLLDNPVDREILCQRVGAHIGSDRIFLLSNKSQEGVQAFKTVLYGYIRERQTVLLEQRSQRHERQLVEALRHQVALERAALAQLKTQTAEQREALRVKIQEARRKEMAKKSELRNRSRQQLQETVQALRDLIDHSEERLEVFIEGCPVEQLQKKGHVQQQIEEELTKTLQPAVQVLLERLLRAIQGEVRAGQSYSTQLLADLDIQLPPYASPLTRVTAEHIMPLAFIGSVLTMGWFSVPTLLLGYLTVKAREFGLTRYADQTGLLDRALDGIKNVAAVGYKKTLKMTLAKTLIDYMNQVADYFREVLEKVTEQALAQINLVEDLEKAMQRLRDEKGMIDQELRLEKAEALLNAVPVVAN